WTGSAGVIGTCPRCALALMRHLTVDPRIMVCAVDRRLWSACRGIAQAAHTRRTDRVESADALQPGRGLISSRHVGVRGLLILRRVVVTVVLGVPLAHSGQANATANGGKTTGLHSSSKAARTARRCSSSAHYP